MRLSFGFYRAGLIGDNVVVLHGIYALRHLYPTALLVVYTNGFGLNIYGQFDFIDELVGIEAYSDEALIEDIDSRNFDCFILSQPNRAKCRLLSRTNCKRLISLATLATVLSPRFETVFISRNLSRTPQYKRMLRLVRKVDSKHYDRGIKTADFAAIRLKAPGANKASIDEFLSGYKAPSRPLVAINPFVRTASHNLSLPSYVELAHRLASLYPDLNFVIPTYKANPDISSDLAGLDSVRVFCNESDLMNIVALLEASRALISPSTSLAHLANNLGLPMIWLCSRRDSYLWRGDQMDPNLFVILREPTRGRKAAMEEAYIESALEKFAYLLPTLC